MVPRLGQKYEFEVEVTSKAIAEYQTDEDFELDLPAAPAIMVGDEIVVEGTDVAEDRLDAVICWPRRSLRKRALWDVSSANNVGEAGVEDATVIYRKYNHL